MKYVPSMSGLWQHSQLLPILHPWAAFYCIVGFLDYYIILYNMSSVDKNNMDNSWVA